MDLWGHVSIGHAFFQKEKPFSQKKATSERIIAFQKGISERISIAIQCHYFPFQYWGYNTYNMTFIQMQRIVDSLDPQDDIKLFR